MTKDHAADILTTGLEGGIGYWSVASKIKRDDDLRVRSVQLEDAEHYAATQYSRGDDVPDAPDFEPVTVTDSDILKACRKIWQDTPKYVTDRLKGICVRLLFASDGDEADDILCEIDSSDADVIVQVAALGSVVYG